MPNNTTVSGVAGHCEWCDEDAESVSTYRRWERRVLTLLCDGCRESFVVCSVCGLLAPEDDARGGAGSDAPLCPACWDECHENCENCGGTFLREDMEYLADPDEYYCGDCGIPSGGRGPIHEHDYTPRLEFFRSAHEILVPVRRDVPTTYFGVELEVEHEGCSSGHHRRTVEELPDFVYAKSDGSLNNGFEVVSHPATWDWWKEHEEGWQKILALLKRNGYKSYQTRTCGMHVHVSKAPLTELHLYKLMLLVYGNYPLFLYLSRRDERHLRQWASFDVLPSCFKRIAKYRAPPSSMGRYFALNLCPQNTLEYRIFRGTLGPRGFFRNMEVVKSTLDFSKSSPIGEVCQDAYHQYVADNRKAFPGVWTTLDMWFKVQKEKKGETPTGETFPSPNIQEGPSNQISEAADAPLITSPFAGTTTTGLGPPVGDGRLTQAFVDFLRQVQPRPDF